MRSVGYAKEFAAGAICNAGTLGILIPPSIVMVVYAAAVDVSVGRMFLGGVIPGLLAGLMLMAGIYSLPSCGGCRRAIGAAGGKFSIREGRPRESRVRLPQFLEGIQAPCRCRRRRHPGQLPSHIGLAARQPGGTAPGGDVGRTGGQSLRFHGQRL